MTKKQFRGLVDNLANVCTFNTSNSYSLSLRETGFKEYYRASLLVFTNGIRYYLDTNYRVLSNLRRKNPSA